MIVMHSKKIAFVHIPKCAGTSIGRALVSYLEEGDEAFGYTPEFEALSDANLQKVKAEGANLLHKHSSYLDLERYLGDRAGEYETFATVRDPWSRLSSWYFFCKKRYAQVREQNSDGATAWDWVSKFPDFNTYAESGQRFPASLLHLCKGASGEVGIDRFFDISDMAECQAYLRERTGHPDLKIKKLNKNLEKPNLLDAGKATSDVSPEAIKKISEFYADEIAYFGFSEPHLA